MSADSHGKGKAEDIDRHVGNRLRYRRILLGLSQQDLGNAVNVSVQQIQKYEKANNRISCGKIYSLAKLLNVPISYFFEEDDSAVGASAVCSTHAEDHETVDRHVGNRLRYRRILLGLSQQDLGNAVNVSVQQIQKYEKANNRISCGKIYSLAKLLNVPISYFFEEDDSAVGASAVCSTHAEDHEKFEHSNKDSRVEKEILLLVRAFREITDQNMRQSVLDLVRTMSGANVK